MKRTIHLWMIDLTCAKNKDRKRKKERDGMKENSTHTWLVTIPFF